MSSTQTEVLCAVPDELESYIRQMQTSLSLVRGEEVLAACHLLHEVRRRGGCVYAFGNGGSASTASHLAVDLGRVPAVDGQSPMRVVSLTDNVPWLTAVANDVSYDECFAHQLRNLLRPGDLALGISASGESANVVRAFEVARDFGVGCLAMVGFDGGRLSGLSTKRIWVDSHDFGVVESLHLFLVHLLVKGLTEYEEPRDAAGPVKSCAAAAIPVSHGPLAASRRTSSRPV